jgi:FAD/FMN-containing dehydrogenase
MPSLKNTLVMPKMKTALLKVLRTARISRANLQVLPIAQNCPINDVHSQINETTIARLYRPTSPAEIAAIVLKAKRSGKSIAIAGGKHAMGGQQFAGNDILIDSTGLKKVLRFNRNLGLIEVESGIMWPELIDYLRQAQLDCPDPWVIVQKQTGADHLSIGGAASANVHGRGLLLRPFVSDIESIKLIDHKGRLLICSRQKRRHLFNLAIGGYGLFGVVYSVTLRLTRRQCLQRRVELTTADELMAKFDERIAKGASYGDFQFSIDNASPDFLHKGILSTYHSVSSNVSATAIAGRALTHNDWQELLYLAHVDKAKAFERYSKHYLATHGQTYMSDTFQLATYLEGYHRDLDERLGSEHNGSEIISELYVPRNEFSNFMKAAAERLRQLNASVVYGTVRLIQFDADTFLPWARESFACIVMNLHAEKTPEGIEKVAEQFRALIDIATSLGGSYYLTYHKFATAMQLQRCYPQFRMFLRWKETYDPQLVFQSDWYRHYRSLLSS